MLQTCEFGVWAQEESGQLTRWVPADIDNLTRNKWVAAVLWRVGRKLMVIVVRKQRQQDDRLVDLDRSLLSKCSMAASLPFRLVSSSSTLVTSAAVELALFAGAVRRLSLGVAQRTFGASSARTRSMRRRGSCSVVAREPTRLPACQTAFLPPPADRRSLP